MLKYKGKNPRKFVTAIEKKGTKRKILPFFPEYLAKSPPRFWGFRNAGPGVVAIYSGVAAGGGQLLEQCELMPDDVVEVLAANCVVQSRDQLGAVVFFATAE